ncbi:hypothetical protein [Pandoraea sputorum]|uniref:hypothetical protein n=1 Tax=Pandoraea sputorum TaxID=93222 RepID=UPI002B303EBF|nr:hypothetical protein THI4931_35380 [Pandoraea sputorum]
MGTHIRTLTIIAASLIFTVPKAMAFEAWGFASGTSKVQVLREARARGDTIDEKPTATFILQRDPDSGSTTMYVLTFCDTRLYSVSKSLTLSDKIYADEKDALTTKFGDPTVTAKDESIKNPAGGWEWRTTSNAWLDGDHEIKLVLTEPTGETIKRGLVPGLTVAHADGSICEGHERSKVD